MAADIVKKKVRVIEFGFHNAYKWNTTSFELKYRKLTTISSYLIIHTATHHIYLHNEVYTNNITHPN